jgi:hypothetical protein
VGEARLFLSEQHRLIFAEGISALDAGRSR